jgi:hypothetical protein
VEGYFFFTSLNCTNIYTYRLHTCSVVISTYMYLYAQINTKKKKNDLEPVWVFLVSSFCWIMTEMGSYFFYLLPVVWYVVTPLLYIPIYPFHHFLSYILHFTPLLLLIVVVYILHSMHRLLSVVTTYPTESKSYLSYSFIYSLLMIHLLC